MTGTPYGKEAPAPSKEDGLEDLLRSFSPEQQEKLVDILTPEQLAKLASLQ